MSRSQNRERTFCGPDMEDMSLLSLEFGDLVGCSSSKYLRTLLLCNLVKKLAEKKGVFDNAMIAMARVLAAKPHSCDVERLISSCNLMKTLSRNSQYKDSKFAFVHLLQRAFIRSVWPKDSSY